MIICNKIPVSRYRVLLEDNTSYVEVLGRTYDVHCHFNVCPFYDETNRNHKLIIYYTI